MSILRSLHERRENLTRQVAGLEEEMRLIDQEILTATQARVQQMFTLSGKQHGTVSVDGGEDGVILKGAIEKKVEWDSGALMKAAAALPWDVVTKVFDIKFKVPEKTYAKLTGFGLGPEVCAAIEGARTTKYGDLKVAVEVKE